jgi:tubulin polyglutamylase TTLL1/tubulin monoglycylase TTLL3/8
VQKKAEEYGRFENGNKISFTDFQKYLTNTFPEREYKFFRTVYPAMIVLAGLCRKWLPMPSSRLAC